MTPADGAGRVGPWWPVIGVLCLTAALYVRSFGVTPIYLGGDEARTDISQSQQIVRQVRLELEEVLRILRR